MIKYNLSALASSDNILTGILSGAADVSPFPFPASLFSLAKPASFNQIARACRIDGQDFL